MSRRFALPSKIPKCLTCPICMGTLDDPLRTKCGHTFCRGCIESLMKAYKNKALCPICRARVFKKHLGTDRIAKLAIDDLKVVCMNKDCSWTGRLADSANHQKTCLLRPDKIDPDMAKMIPDKNIGDEEDIDEGLSMSLISEIYVNHPSVARNIFAGADRPRMNFELFNFEML